MGMFEDEEKKMAEEAADAARREAQKKVELNQLARKISEDLMSYMGNRSIGASIETSVDENRVTLRKTTTSNTLEIECTDPERFQFAVDGTPTAAADKSGMIRSVIEWLKR
jgi:hypothetical protein